MNKIDPEDFLDMLLSRVTKNENEITEEQLAKEIYIALEDVLNAAMEIDHLNQIHLTFENADQFILTIRKKRIARQ